MCPKYPEKTQIFHPLINSRYAYICVPATLLKKRLWHICFLLNFVEFLGAPLINRKPLVAASEEDKFLKVNRDALILFSNIVLLLVVR